jgi:hypothetical protein
MYRWPNCLRKSECANTFLVQAFQHLLSVSRRFKGSLTLAIPSYASLSPPDAGRVVFSSRPILLVFTTKGFHSSQSFTPDRYQSRMSG